MRITTAVFIIAFLAVTNVVFINAYTHTKKQSEYRLENSTKNLERCEDLKRENTLLKAEIVILQRAGKDSRLDVSNDIATRQGWALLP